LVSNVPIKTESSWLLKLSDFAAIWTEVGDEDVLPISPLRVLVMLAIPPPPLLVD
jgi:hypothetical protein